MGGEGTEEIVMSDPSRATTRSWSSRTTSWWAPACTETRRQPRFKLLLREAAGIADIRDKLMFGESNLGDAGHQGQEQGRGDGRRRRGVRLQRRFKGVICKAIKEKGLFTLDEVRKQTKASASCGSCTGLVEQIIMFTAGGDYSAAPKKKAVCGCTDHDARRCAMRSGPTACSRLQGP